jgi:hypothetical protein
MCPHGMQAPSTGASKQITQVPEGVLPLLLVSASFCPVFAEFTVVSPSVCGMVTSTGVKSMEGY